MALSNQKAKFYISPTAIDPTDIPFNLAAFDAEFATMIWVQGMVEVPDFGVTQNMLTQATTDTEIAEKQGGISSGNDTTVAFAFREADDTGIAAMEVAAADANGIYVVAKEMGNKPNATGTGTRFYALAIIGGGGGPGGTGVEDFANRTYSLAITHQRPVEKAAAAGV